MENKETAQIRVEQAEDNQNTEIGAPDSNGAPILKCGDAAEEKPKRKRFKVLGVEFVYLYILAIVTAFLGWIAENTVRIVTLGILDCRFHVLPFISPYGLIVFAVHLAFNSPDDIAVFGKKIFKTSTVRTKILCNFITWFTMCAFVFGGELAIGNLWNALFGVKLWDYSQLPLHVTRYSGLIPALGYGTGAYLLFKFVYMPALNFVRRKLSYKVAFWIVCTLGVLIVLDTVAMVIQLAVFNAPPVYWSVKLW